MLPIYISFTFFGLQAKPTVATKIHSGENVVADLQSEKSADYTCGSWGELSGLKWGLKRTLHEVEGCWKSAGAWHKILKADRCWNTTERSDKYQVMETSWKQGFGLPLIN